MSDSGRYSTPQIRLDESGMWVLRKYHEDEVERLRDALHVANLYAATMDTDHARLITAALDA